MKYKLNCPACKKIAFYYDAKPIAGEPASSELTTKGDGTKPKPGEMPICCHCGHKLTWKELRVEGWEEVE